ncbi:pyridoxamine 5'-phosphate oxidase family protein [Dehalococcoides mccartyi]|nr:pyridoxamine 5'-phosphate oxidase family protein [Dehalococcoides mccartyi]
MATYYDSITDQQAELIQNSPMFFVASVPADLSGGPNDEGAVNLSPKGGNPLLILDSNRVAYLDFAGSGNETARHANTEGPITIMVCSFSDEAAIIRLYGHASVHDIDDHEFSEQLQESFEDDIALPARQVVDIRVDRTVTSCGYGVPVMNYVSERSTAYRGRKYK